MSNPAEETDACVVMTTCPSNDEATSIAKMLLDRQLAACIQVADITSHYTWQGKQTMEAEKLLLIKTRLGLYPKVQAAILAAHSYEVPEVLCLPVRDGSPAYLGWMRAVTQGSSE